MKPTPQNPPALNAPTCHEANALRGTYIQSNSTRDRRNLSSHMRNCPKCLAIVAQLDERAALPLDITDEMLEALR